MAAKSFVIKGLSKVSRPKYNYARRVFLARQRGFVDPSGKVNPYTYYRRATEYANADEQFTTAVGNTGVDAYGTEHALDEARILYEAFVLGDKDDYSIHMRNGKPVVKYDDDGTPIGARAVALITILKYVPSAAAWRRLYPTKTRFGHLALGTSQPKRPRKVRSDKGGKHAKRRS